MMRACATCDLQRGAPHLGGRSGADCVAPPGDTSSQSYWATRVTERLGLLSGGWGCAAGCKGAP